MNRPYSARTACATTAFAVFSSLLITGPALSNERVDARENPAAARQWLQRIGDGYKKASKEPSRNIRLSGFVNPNKRAFTYATYEGMARFQIEFVTPSAGRIVLHRLDDGETMYKLDGGGLTIDSREQRLRKWRSLSDPVARHLSPFFEEEYMDVAERSNWLIHLINNTGPFEGVDAIQTGAVTLEVSEVDGGLIAVALQQRPPEDAQRKEILTVLRYVVSPAKGFNLMSHVENYGWNPDQWRYTTTIKNEYQELAPGIWVLSRGKYNRHASGRAVQKNNIVPTLDEELVVEKAEIGDFAIDDVYFSADSLPIKIGTSVEDHRVNPHVNFVFGKGGSSGPRKGVNNR